MNKIHISTFAVALCGGALLGEAAWRAELGQSSQMLPKNWGREPLQIPYKLAAHLGNLTVEPGELALDYYRGIYPQQNASSLSFDFRLPEDGQIELWMSSPHKILPELCGSNPRAKECASTTYPAAGIVVENIEEPSTQTIRGKDYARLRCNGALPKPVSGKNSLSYMMQRNAVTFGLNGKEITCQASHTQLPPLIRPGIRKIHISNVRLNGERVPLIRPSSKGLLFGIGALVCTFIAWIEYKRKVRDSLALLTTTPLLLVIPLLSFDWRSWIESMRASWLPWQWMPFIVPFILYISLKILHHAGHFLHEKNAYRADSYIPGVFVQGLLLIPIFLLYGFNPLKSNVENSIATGVLLGLLIFLPRLLERQGALLTGSARFVFALLSTLGLIVAWNVNALHVWSGLWAGLFGLTTGILIWANAQARHFSLYNPICLAASLFLFVSAEGFLRGTKAGRQWSNNGARTEKNDMFGWISKANQGFALMEEGKHRAYPDEGYPTFFNDKKTSAYRLVALGGSTTGGAYQNDDLNEFYPAKLQQKLNAQWEVINQGVGGWTTWHIERYLEKKMTDLNPDVMTLYIGHNDLLTSVPIPYKQLYRAWQSGSFSKGFGSKLGEFRLYHFLRHFVVSVRPATQRAAVPIEHAQDNLREIIKLAQENKTRIMLASEGLAPDPGPMKTYNEMLVQLAKEHDSVHYVDIADKLHRYPSPKVYLDDCHLTQYGHSLVAEWIAQELETVSWIPPLKD